MAQVDVTELLSDPDFVDAMSIITRVPAVNTFGETLLKETLTTTVGSIQPADYKTLKRLPEALQNENVSSFWVNGEIRTTENCDYPAILVFRGRRYQVRQVADWTNFGPGYSEGICVQEKVA